MYILFHFSRAKNYSNFEFIRSKKIDVDGHLENLSEILSRNFSHFPFLLYLKQSTRRTFPPSSTFLIPPLDISIHLDFSI